MNQYFGGDGAQYVSFGLLKPKCYKKLYPNFDLRTFPPNFKCDLYLVCAMFLDSLFDYLQILKNLIFFQYFGIVNMILSLVLA